MSTIAKRSVRLTAVYNSFLVPYLFEFSGSDYISLQENVPSEPGWYLFRALWE